MENLDLKQMSSMVDIIAEEKGLPKETVLNVIEQIWVVCIGNSIHIAALSPIGRKTNLHIKRCYTT